MSAQSHPLPIESYLVRVDVHGAPLHGQLDMPAEPRGVVVLAQGGGNGRHNPRYKLLAEYLREAAGVGTLLVDLLSPAEEAVELRVAALRFDIPVLASRVLEICDWLMRSTRTRGLPIGLLGSSTAAAADLAAAAERPDDVAAIVSSAGRPDLAASWLARVKAPTLLIVGGFDPTVLELNRTAARSMSCEREVAIVPGAGRGLDEPLALAEVGRRAARWFDQYLPAWDAPEERPDPR